MIETSWSHISIIQCLFLMKFVELDSNSNLVLWLKSHLIPRCYEDLAYILVQWIIDSICFVRYEAFFAISKSIFDTRIFFSLFLVLMCF